MTIFGDGEKWSRKKCFEIPRAPLNIPANQPGQFSPSGQIFRHWAAATSEGACGISKYFFLDHSLSILNQKRSFQDSRF